MKLKKLFAIALLLTCTYTSVSAQGNSSDAKDGVVLENKSFWSNWYVGAGVGGFLYLGDSYSSDMSVTPSFELYATKWFSPVIALRGRVTYSNAVGGQGSNFNLAMLNADVMINVLNLFCGYDADRAFNLNPYYSAGLAASGSGKRITGGFGVNSTYTLSESFDLSADLKGGAFYNGLDNYRAGSEHEGYVSLTVGVNYKFNPQGWAAYSPAKRGGKGGASSAELAAIRAELKKTKVKVNDLETELEISEAKVKAKTGLDAIDKDREAYFDSIK